jgi:hypothetical protein
VAFEEDVRREGLELRLARPQVVVATSLRVAVVLVLAREVRVIPLRHLGFAGRPDAGEDAVLAIALQIRMQSIL